MQVALSHLDWRAYRPASHGPAVTPLSLPANGWSPPDFRTFRAAQAKRFPRRMAIDHLPTLTQHRSAPSTARLFRHDRQPPLFRRRSRLSCLTLSASDRRPSLPMPLSLPVAHRSSFLLEARRPRVSPPSCRVSVLLTELRGLHLGTHSSPGVLVLRGQAPAAANDEPPASSRCPAHGRTLRAADLKCPGLPGVRL
jgi:hypothetical protein